MLEGSKQRAHNRGEGLPPLLHLGFLHGTIGCDGSRAKVVVHVDFDLLGLQLQHRLGGDAHLRRLPPRAE